MCASSSTNERVGARREFARLSLWGGLLPAPERAFPTGWHDRLVKAAVHADDACALAHVDAWLGAIDIDTASPRDHRLLVEVAARFGPRLAAHAAYPRLVGLRRMLWTRGLVALRKARPALATMAEAGVEMLLFKGGARLADAGHARGERIAHDIDIAVRPEEMAGAFDILAGHGWMAAQGVSHHYVREHLASMRGVRMFRTHFGDIHLHARPFRPGQGEGTDDDALRERSRRALLDGVGVWLAAPEDGLALSVAHGGLDAHADSDWLVDAAGVVARHAVDWGRFEAIVEARSLQAPALIALSYLSGEACLPIPPLVLAAIARAARARPLGYLAGFAQARPHYRATIASNAIRGVARLLHKREARRQSQRASDRWLDARRTATGDSDGGLPAIEQHIAVPPRLRQGRAHFHAVLQIAVPPVRRRIEFEVNGAVRHICRIRYRKWRKGDRLLTLAIDGPIDISDEVTLKLVSRPSRLLRHDSGPAQKARYDALPFRSIRLEISEDRSGNAAGPSRKPRSGA